MAAVPCVATTCSITPTQDANGVLNLNVNLNASGGIECDDGLKAKLLGDPVAVASGSVADCDNLLGITTDGDLFASRPQFHATTLQSAKVGVPDGGTSGYSTNTTITNSEDCDRLVLVSATWALQYTVAGAGAYKQEILFGLEMTGGFTSEQEYDLAGYNSVGASDLRAIQQSFSTFVTLGGGNAMTFRTYASSTQEENSTANGGGWNGLTGRVRIAVVDLKPGSLFSQ